MQRTSATPEYDVALFKADMTEKGWLPVDLARKARVSHMTVSRFFSGERQTARTAKKLAGALGHSLRRYLPAREAVAS
jgi:transcriptional regulator with XRE-family HTH domain